MSLSNTQRHVRPTGPMDVIYVKVMCDHYEMKSPKEGEPKQPVRCDAIFEWNVPDPESAEPATPAERGAQARKLALDDGGWSFIETEDGNGLDKCPLHK